MNHFTTLPCTSSSASLTIYRGQCVPGTILIDPARITPGSHPVDPARRVLATSPKLVIIALLEISTPEEQQELLHWMSGLLHPGPREEGRRQKAEVRSPETRAEFLAANALVMTGGDGTTVSPRKISELREEQHLCPSCGIRLAYAEDRCPRGCIPMTGPHRNCA